MDEAKCNKWALEGECQINPDWMISNCRKSCRSCVETKVPDKEDKDVEPDDGNFIRLLQWVKNSLPIVALLNIIILSIYVNNYPQYI